MIRRPRHLPSAVTSDVLNYLTHIREYLGLGDLQIILMEKEANKWAETEDEVLAAVDTSS